MLTNRELIEMIQKWLTFCESSWLFGSCGKVLHCELSYWANLMKKFGFTFWISWELLIDKKTIDFKLRAKFLKSLVCLSSNIEVWCWWNQNTMDIDIVQKTSMKKCFVYMPSTKQIWQMGILAVFKTWCSCILSWLIPLQLLSLA